MTPSSEAPPGPGSSEYHHKGISGETARQAGGYYAESILRSLRKIIRAVDRHSRKLSREFNLTVPQLVCLRQLILAGPSSPGTLAAGIYLSQATVTGILDRLETRSLIKRERSSPDRRKVKVSLTESGRQLARDLPWPLQERFAERLSAMPKEGQQTIDRTLKQVVDMMEAQKIDAWPIAGTGVWNHAAEPVNHSE